MDCPSEERLVRMAIEQAKGVVRLDFDLADRRLSVLHNTDAEQLLELLAPLGFDARIAEDDALATTTDAAASSVAASEASTLKVLLAINAVMFVVESTAGWLAESTGLMADSLDMFADAAVYGLSLYAVGKAASLQARAARPQRILAALSRLGCPFRGGPSLCVGKRSGAAVYDRDSAARAHCESDLPRLDRQASPRRCPHARKLDLALWMKAHGYG